MMSGFTITPLYSGSSGNATLITAGKTNILIDAGKNCKHLCLALKQAGISPDDIDALFITHVHSDHVGAVDVFVRNHPTKLYATSFSHRFFDRRYCWDTCETECIVVEPGNGYEIAEDVTVSCCETSHDSGGSVCYRIDHRGRSCMVMTDSGYVTEAMKEFGRGVNAVLLESNYDKRMLAYGPYPEDLKVRIAGRKGHLSNDDSAEMSKFLIENGTTDIILGHLSENNNTPERAYMTTVEYLARYSYEQGRDYNITVANRNEPTRGTDII